MSITSYSDLQSSVANWIARSDLDAIYPDCITLFETEANRKLKVRQMMVTQSTTPSSGQFPLPSDFLAYFRVTWLGASNIRSLDYVHPDYFQSHFPDGTAGTPRIFTIEGSTDNVGVVKLAPPDSTVINFGYYQKITSLSTSNTSNWLLAAHPDVYLAGTLTEANVFAKDYDTAAIWKARRDGLLDEITMLDQKYRAPSAIRVPGRNP